MTEKEQWYSNKELFDLFLSLKDDLYKTRESVKKYNNLVEKMHNAEIKLDKTCLELRDVQIQLSKKFNKSEGRKEAFESIRSWTPWLITIFTLLFAAWKGGAF